MPNSDYALRIGITAEIAIDVGEVTAHKISPAALDDDGNIGVRIVDREDGQCSSSGKKMPRRRGWGREGRLSPRASIGGYVGLSARFKSPPPLFSAL